MRTPKTLAGLLLAPVATLLVVAAPRTQEVSADLDHYAEPPREVIVTVGDERVRIAVGAEGALGDGTRITVEQLPVRTFRASGAFTFAYPQDWAHSGGGTATAGWWHVRGDGVAVHLQKHEQDAAELARRYADNLESSGSLGRRDVVRVIGGVRMKGVEVKTPAFSIGGRSPYEAWIHEVFGHTAPDGSSWLIVFQRGVPTPKIAVDLQPLEIIIDGKTPTPVSWIGAEPPDPRPAALDAIATSWTWRS